MNDTKLTKNLLVMMTCMALSACAVKSPVFDKTPPQDIIKNESDVPNYYQVKQGDTIAKIATQYGLDWQELATLNNLGQKNTIHTGQWIVLWGQQPMVNPQTPLQTDRLASDKKEKKTALSRLKDTLKSKKDQAIKAMKEGHDNAGEAMLPAVDSAKTIDEHDMKKSVSTTVVSQIVAPTTSTTPMATPTSITSTPVAMPPKKEPFTTQSLLTYAKPVKDGTALVRQFGEGTGSMQSQGLWYRGHDGDPVYAMADGKVSFIDESGSDGVYVHIRHYDGVMSQYRFVKNVVVEPNQIVRQGERIASLRKAQSTGLAIVEFRVLKDGVHVDPATYVK